jgi:hypothetical protein
MAQEEYYSFEDVLKDLEIGEDELKRMVSEGELRAFRDENKMKFRRDDVENLRKGRTSEPTLILPAQQDDQPPAADTAETILDLDSAQSDDAGPALELPGTEQQSDTQDVTKQLDFTDTDITVADEPVAVGDAPSGDAEEGTTTEPLQLVEEGTTEPVPTEEGGEAMAAAAAAPSRRRRTIEITEADEEAIESRRPHWVWSIGLAAAFVFTAWSGFFIYDMLRITSGKAPKPTGMTEGLAKKFTDSVYADSDWIKRVWSRNYPPNTTPPQFEHKAVWQFSLEEKDQAMKGVSIDESMKVGSGTPDAAAPAPAPAPAPVEKKDAPETPKPAENK